MNATPDGGRIFDTKGQGMKHGLKERLKELDDRNDAACALGHGLLDCPDTIQAQVADTLLEHVAKRAARLDIVLAMENQGIKPTANFKAEYDAEVSKERDRRQRQAENARLARDELADFRAWKASRPQRVKARPEVVNGHGPGKITAVRDVSDDE